MADERAWHALEAEEAVAALETDPALGLSAQEVAVRIERFGPNALAGATSRSALSVFLHQFASPLIWLLGVAAIVSIALGHASDAIVIGVVVLLNAVIGTIQEGRAERALAALRQMATIQARVVRGGRDELVRAEELVPGDVLSLMAGDAIAADARLLDDAALQTAEAALTGESVPVAKSRRAVPPETTLADRHSMVYAGTHVTAGRARAVVIATGPSTEIGHIAALAEGATQPKTPLERRIDQFGRYVLIAAVVIFALVIGVGVLRGLPAELIFMVGISQMVGMVPEGLPVAMTIALAVGVQRMARRGAIVRRLAAVETLGSTTVICTDKTGTLTRNEMTVTELGLPGGRAIVVDGTGYAPTGAFTEAGAAREVSADPALRALLEAAVLCNDAELLAPADDDPRWRPVGDPTEAALVTVAMKGGLVPAQLRAQHPRRAEIPFDPAVKMMATQHATPGGARIIVKGAPEMVLELCAGVDHAAVRAAADRMADRALRVLAVAVIDGAELGPIAPGAEAEAFAAFTGRASLLGLIGQIDPPRPEVAAAVTACRAAGIRPVMVTGDHRATALAIGRTLGIVRDGDLALEGRELAELSEPALAAQLDRVSVFARVQPAHKLRIVEAYQRTRQVVAMTGDGVNDAPALVCADVGVAMGVTGTEVAKQAAKIVITDDNFATITAAVEEGRVVYANMKKAILFMAATSLAEVIVLLAALVLGYPPPFTPAQILWNNLVTEGLIVINLVLEPAEGDEMRRPPTPPGEPLLTRPLLARLAIITPSIVVATLGWYLWRVSSGASHAIAQTETFTLLVVCEWFNVLNCRSRWRSALTLGVFTNRWLLGGLLLANLLQILVVFVPLLNGIFQTVPIELEQVLLIGAVGSLVLWVEELRELVVRRRMRWRAGCTEKAA